MTRTTHPLSLEDLATIASAHPGATSAALARQLGHPYFTVHKALQRLRQAGGWFTPLCWHPCTECGQPAAWSGNHRFTAHKPCARARINRHARERRRRVPGLSTPYVRAWRQRNPETLVAMREREKARLRERWPDRPEDERATILARLHAADQRDYPLTLDEALNSGTRWTEEEDHIILERLNDPARDVALALGRTLWAVRGRRVRLRRAQDEGSPGGRSCGQANDAGPE